MNGIKRINEARAIIYMKFTNDHDVLVHNGTRTEKNMCADVYRIATHVKLENNDTNKYMMNFHIKRVYSICARSKREGSCGS